jgi:hypothetical protein
MVSKKFLIIFWDVLNLHKFITIYFVFSLLKFEIFLAETNESFQQKDKKYLPIFIILA